MFTNVACILDHRPPGCTRHVRRHSCRQKVQYFRSDRSFLNHENVIERCARAANAARERAKPLAAAWSHMRTESNLWNIVDQHNCAANYRSRADESANRWLTIKIKLARRANGKIAKFR